MIPVDEHRARILDEARPLPPETVPLALAAGRVVGERVHTRWPVPVFDNSGMDGYAVVAADAREGVRLRVVADVPAGSARDPRLGPGEAARIMTGAPLPSDADAVVPLEHTDLGAPATPEPPQWIVVTRAPAPGAHIRRAGDDAPAGALVADTGTELGPWQLSAIASAGRESVRVHRRPRVAVISTGSELVPPASALRRGQIPESNSVLLGAAILEAGADVVSSEVVPDDPDLLRAALGRAQADVIVLSGGASVGALDVVRAVLGRSSVRFDEVAMQPGKPQGFGVDPSGALLLCLPGNPVGVAVSFELFVRPALRRLGGHAGIDRARVELRSAESWQSRRGRLQLVPIVVEGGEARRVFGAGAGSHRVHSLAAADGLAVVPEEVEHVFVGDTLSVMLVGPRAALPPVPPAVSIGG
ncbi:molybdopterin molybdotransferase MoeA [Leifsonia sp. AG29]|uniref:molybdopterin molybdotransferase MoeA n=1 Tax=Leifsonia sp. AG29 TaxID=2598860 RepID=UPI00131A8E0F|nr:gephyrin-like molybdotransferase Glp [Leifsonia sp. AG29]